MADCVECGSLPGETGYKCNQCGREVCWDHRRPADHDCLEEANAEGESSTAVETGSTALDGPGEGSRAGESPADERARSVRPPDPEGEAPTGTTPGDDHAQPELEVELDGPGATTVPEPTPPDERAYPWWVYVIVVGLFVAPSLVSIVFAIL